MFLGIFQVEILVAIGASRKSAGWSSSKGSEDSE
jgi:hypothetical protein